MEEESDRHMDLSPLPILEASNSTKLQLDGIKSAKSLQPFLPV